MQLSEFKQLLKKANMNKKDFAALTKISYGTVNSWGVEGRAEVPEWIRPFLENYIKVQKLELIKEIVNKNDELI